MKEIKFRAWFDHEKRMIDWYDTIFIKLDENGINTTSAHLCEYPMRNATSKTNILKYMQYTGLKDINAVELYEDDIIIFSDCPRLYRITWQGGGFHAFLIPGISKFKLRAEGRVMRNIANADCERVGNAWENPELFKEAK